MSKKYILILSQKQGINTYRSENLKSLIKTVINKILNSYDFNFDIEELQSEDFNFPKIQDLFYTRSEANALKYLVKFKESLSDTNIELNENSNYQFSEPNDQWSLKFEECYKSTIISGFTTVNKKYPTHFHIEEI
jgi:hypothetical protein